MAEITTKEEDPLGEVLLHGVDILQENLPALLKRLRQTIFKNPFGVPMPGSPYASLYNLIIFAESGIGLAKAHLEKSSMDRLRACQTAYAALRSSKDSISALTDTEIDPVTMKSMVDEVLTSGSGTISKFFASLSSDDLRFVTELIQTVNAFFEVAGMLGGDEVFLPKPDPVALAKMQAMFSLPQKCPIHLPQEEKDAFHSWVSRRKEEGKPVDPIIRGEGEDKMDYPMGGVIITKRE